MSAILTIDESSGLQYDDTSNALPTEFNSILFAITGVAPATVGLSGFGTAATTDDYAATFGPNVSAVRFTLASPAGVDSGLTTVSGKKIFLFVHPDDDNVVLAREANPDGTANAAGALTFAAYLDTQTAAAGDVGATGARLWIAQYSALFHPDGTNANDIVTLQNVLSISVNNYINFSAAGAPSGQNLFMMFGDGTPSPDDATVVVTGREGNTVNTGKGGGTTTIGSNNQMIDPAEGMFFTFVKGANTDYTVPNLDQNEADVEANIDFGTYFGATSASFAVVQLQPPKGATLLITAIDNTDTTEKGPAGTYISGLEPANDELVNITSVTITRSVTTGKTSVVESFTFTEGGTPPVPNGGLTLDFSGESARVTGVIAGDRVAYSTGTTEHNRVLIDNVGNTEAKLNAAFDIGDFRLESGALTTTALGPIDFVDDGPTSAAALDTGMVRHDETASQQADADDVPGPVAAFSGILNISGDMGPGYAAGTQAVISSAGKSGGFDGLASTVYSLGVSAPNADSGLDTTEGNDILLNKEGALVVGRISGGANDGKAAFAVAIDSSTGLLSMVQYHSVKHQNTASHDESLSIANAALLAFATVTDGDGDTDTKSVAIGARVSIQDDGPTADAALGAGMVRHDETAGNQADADDVTGPVAAFSGVSNASTDMAAGYATGTGSGAVINAGASTGGVDGLASTVYSLGVSAAGVDSGLDTTEGDNILLTQEGDLVIGRISSAGANNTKAAFALAIDPATGVLSMVQYHSIMHPVGGASHDEALSIANAALLAVATVTDGDGDTSSASVAIGARVSIQDDGPAAAASLGAGGVAHDETAGLQGDANDVAGPVAAFAGLLNTSTDMGPGYATGTAAVVSASDSTGGVDGVASAVFSLDIAEAGVDSGLDTTEGNDILLTREGNLVVGRISSAGADNGLAAFAVAINAGTGVLSMVQYHSVRHPTGGASHDESLSIANAALLAVTTVTDGDGDTSTASVAIGARVSIQDDGPTAVAVLAGGVVRHDETAGLQADADDVAGPIAAFTGVANVSSDMTAGYAAGTASPVNSSASSSGVDQPAVTAYTLDVAAAAVDSGLDTTEGNNILLTKEGDLVVGRISGGADSGKAAFAVAINSTSGLLSMVQYHSIKHPTGGLASPDESVSIAGAALLAVVTLTDADGDIHSASVEIGSQVSFQDDAPAINGRSDLIYANSSNPAPGGTGFFDYTMGVDQHVAPFSASNSDFSGVALTGGMVGANAITDRSVTWASEDAASAVFNVAFKYISNPGLNTIADASGTLTFDKVADTYTLSLAAPIQSFTILTTANANFTGYAINTSTVDNTQPAVSVATLASNFYAQFSGYSEPGGGTGANNLQVGGDQTFTDGELFIQDGTWVSVSGTAVGVAGDTIQKGEVLDLDFFTSNPAGNIGAAPTGRAAGIYMKFDGIGSEDLVVVLKLAQAGDAANTIVTTRAIVIDNADIFKFGATLPAGYNLTLDNNDGVVIIESNDFNDVGENYVIVGAQVLVSTEGIAGSGINLDGASGADGGSFDLAAQDFGVATTDNDVVKISEMGFLSTVTPNAKLTFEAAVIDADGDVTPTQTLDVTLVSGATFIAGADREAIQGVAGAADTFVFGAVAHSPAGAAHDVIGGFVSGTDKIDLSGIDANSIGGTANDAFIFVGGAFTNVAGQLRFDAATHTLQGDVNGDGTADLVIVLTGVNAINSAPGGDILY